MVVGVHKAQIARWLGTAGKAVTPPLDHDLKRKPKRRVHRGTISRADQKRYLAMQPTFTLDEKGWLKADFVREKRGNYRSLPGVEKISFQSQERWIEHRAVPPRCRLRRTPYGADSEALCFAGPIDRNEAQFFVVRLDPPFGPLVYFRAPSGRYGDRRRKKTILTRHVALRLECAHKGPVPAGYRCMICGRSTAPPKEDRFFRNLT